MANQSKEIIPQVCRKVGEIYHELQGREDLTTFITCGIPMAIGATLRQMMEEERVPEVSIPIDSPNGNLMTFSLKCNKKGDSISFLPAFELGEYGLKILNSDVSESNKIVDLITKSDISDIAYSLVGNKTLIRNIENSIRANVLVDGEWIPSDERKLKISQIGDDGVVYDDFVNGIVINEAFDLCAIFVIMIGSILEICSFCKDTSSVFSLPIDYLGTFNVSSSKSGFSLTLEYNKAFKGYCKNDKLAEEFVSILD